MADNNWSRLLAEASNLPPGRFTRDHWDQAHRIVPNPRRTGRPEESSVPGNLAMVGVATGIFTVLIPMLIDAWRPEGTESSPHIFPVMIAGIILMAVGPLIGWLAGQPAKMRALRRIAEWEASLPTVRSEQAHLDAIHADSLERDHRRIIDLFDTQLAAAQGIQTGDRSVDTQLDELKGPLRGIVRWEIASSLLTIQQARKHRTSEGAELVAACERRILEVFDILDQITSYALVARSKQGGAETLNGLQEVLARLHALDEVRGETPRRLREDKSSGSRRLREEA